MPEGHTIHALAERLERVFGRSVVSADSPQGRFAAEARLIDGHEMVAVEARGKHLFADFGGAILHVHLGLIGSFHVKPRAVPEVDPDRTAPAGTASSSAVRLRLSNPTHTAELRGPMICALIDQERRHEIESRLGPDPLDAGALPERALARLSRSKKSVAELLMDQSVIAGVGNVYRCEVLHRQRINPYTPGNELGRVLWERAWEDLAQLMRAGKAFGQILTMQDQVDAAMGMMADGSATEVTERLTGERLGDYFERRFHVYQRTGLACDRCGRVVREATVAGRTLYWCPGCQTRRRR